MFDIVASIKKLNLNLTDLEETVDALGVAIGNISSGGGGFSPVFSGPVTFASAGAPFIFDKGNGDGAAYNVFSVRATIPKGIGFVGPDNAVKGFLDGTNGILDLKGGMRVNGVSVVTMADFHPSDYANVAGQAFTGSISAPSASISGTISAATGSFQSAAVTAGITAASITLTGAVSAATLTLTGALTGTSASFSSEITVPSILAGTAGGNGGVRLQTGGKTNSGYIEFTVPGTPGSRYGYVGYSTAAGVINVSAERNGGYVNFVTSNGAVDPKINGNTIWHAGNLTPGEVDPTKLVMRSGGVLASDLDVATFALNRVGALNLIAGSGNARISIDNNVNNITFRTGASGSYKTVTLGADGGLALAGPLTGVSSVSASSVTAATATLTTLTATNFTGTAASTFQANLTVHNNNSTGRLTLGTGSNRYLEYNGTNYGLAGADLYINGNLAFHSGNFSTNGLVTWGSARSFQDGGVTPLVLMSKPTAIADPDGFHGAIRVQSADSSGNTAAYMEFLIQNRYGVYFGIDTDYQLKIGGWSNGAAAQKIWHEGNVIPVTQVRWVYRGAVYALDRSTGPGDYSFKNPWSGGVMTGFASDGANIIGATFHSLQYVDVYGRVYDITY